MSTQFEFDFEKAMAAILYLASDPKKVTKLDKLKLAKLLFFADKYHLVRYGRPILGDFYNALELGPVPQRTIDFIHALLNEAKKDFVDEDQLKNLAEALAVDRRFHYPRLSAKKKPNLEVLSESDLDALSYIIKEYGQREGLDLANLTHRTPAFRKAWHSRKSGENTVPMEYENFFDEDSDAVEGAREEMLENAKMARAFPRRISSGR